MADEVVFTSSSTIPQVLRERIKLNPDRIAQIDGDVRMTYAEFGEQVNRIASGLLDLGIQPGEKIAMVLPDSNTFPLTLFAIIQMGCIAVGVNPTLRPNEIRHLLNDSESVAVIIAERFHGVDPIKMIEEMRNELPHLRHVIVDGKRTTTGVLLKDVLKGVEIRTVFHPAKPNDLAALIYTSGTMGLPKGSMHSHYTLLYPLMADPVKMPTPGQIINIIKRYGWSYFRRLIIAYRKPIRIMSSMPPYTGAGIVGAINIFLMGRIAVHMDRFIPSIALSLIEEEQVNILAVTPAFATLIVRNPALMSIDLSSLLYIIFTASPVPPQLVDEIMDKIGCPVMIVYAATEFVGGPASTNPFRDSKNNIRETVGKVSDRFEAKIVNKNRQPIPTGEIGELAIRGGVRMLGYYKAEKLTHSAYDEEGWFYTGDLATMDEDGYLRIVGRLKDMIIRAGQNIYPAELESTLRSHHKINQAAVIGVPDSIAGERVLAYIIPESEFTLTPLEVLTFCRENMAPYKIPSEVFFVDSFPLSTTGKVLKRVLREDAIKRA